MFLPHLAPARNCMRLQVLELDHVSEINQEVAAEVCREGLKGLEMLVLTSTPVTPKALLHFNSEYEDWQCQLKLKPPIGPCQLNYWASLHRQCYITPRYLMLTESLFHMCRRLPQPEVRCGSDWYRRLLWGPQQPWGKKTIWRDGQQAAGNNSFCLTLNMWYLST